MPDMSCRSRLAKINDQLTSLEQRVEFIEARVSSLVQEHATTVSKYTGIVFYGI